MVLNNVASALPNVVAAEAADRLLSVKGPDRLAELRASRPSRRSGTPAVPNTKPALALADYTGTYQHPAFGDVRIEADGDGLKAVFNAASLSLKHHHYDTFSTSVGLARFSIDEHGKPSTVYLPVESAVPALAFVRR